MVMSQGGRNVAGSAVMSPLIAMTSSAGVVTSREGHLVTSRAVTSSVRAVMSRGGRCVVANRAVTSPAGTVTSRAGRRGRGPPVGTRDALVTSQGGRGAGDTPGTAAPGPKSPGLGPATTMTSSTPNLPSVASPRILGGVPLDLTGWAIPGAAEEAADDVTDDVTGGYLLSGCDVFVTREPCALCGAALLHARAVFYRERSRQGALGTRYGIHGHPKLNHRYRLWGERQQGQLNPRTLGELGELGMGD
uniref:CMP/dCMP-type deaminase domain-containing protein n=1 Tax=Ficedula albicollis TaxID=59894 RepID=A0A803VD18_FICAL